MINIRIFAATIAVLAGLLGQSACSHMPQQVRDKVSMNSVAAARKAQTLNPSASDNRKAASGLDPSAAQQVQESYVKSFAPKKATSGNNVFLGLTGVGSGQ